MYPEGAHELEHKFEQAFGHAAMGVAYAYLFQKVKFYQGIASLTVAHASDDFADSPSAREIH